MRACGLLTLAVLGWSATGCTTELGGGTDGGVVIDAARDANLAQVDAREPYDSGSPTPDATSDAGPSDAGGGDAGPPDVGPRGPVLYPFETRHSPLPGDLTDALQALAARTPDREDDVFAKVGDSITVSPAFLACFTGGTVDLGGRDALRASIEHFAMGNAGGTDPFRRVSLAAGVSWTAGRVLMGSPSDLDRELAALRPRFASLMYGTNDVGFIDLDTYGRNMTTIVDTMLAAGTIPILSSIPPRDDSTTADARVPIFSLLVRALAQSRGVPFVDLHRELLALSDHGLLASDGVHLTSSMGGCVLTPAGLRAGSNVRNLLVLEALDRARRVVVRGEDALDTTAPRLAGSGTASDPFVVASLPFAAHGNTRTMGEASVDRWEGCSTANESGRELRFRFHLDSPARVTGAVSSGAGADLDVHLVRAGGSGADCVARDNRQVDVDLAAGDWDLVIDTFAGSSGPLPGEALVMLVTR